MTTKATTSKADLKQLGVMFLNTSEKTGNKYFNGEVLGEKMVGFINTFVAKTGKNAGQEMTVINLYEPTEADPSKVATTPTSKRATKKVKDIF